MNKFTQAKLASTAPYVQVTGDIGDFSIGAVLTKPMDIAQYWREQAEQGDVTLTLDDDTIIGVMQSIPGQPATVDLATLDDNARLSALSPAEDWEIEVCGAVLSRNKGNAPVTTSRVLPDQRPVTPTSSDARYKAGSVAGLAGERWDADETFRKHMDEAVHAPEKVKRAPFDMMLDALRIEGVTVNKYGMVTDTFATMELFKYPVPGSYPSEDYDKGYKKNGTVRKEDMNRFAEYKRELSGSMASYDWYEDAFNRMAQGKTIEAELALLREATPPKNSGAAASGKYGNKSNNWKENQKKLWSGRKTAGVRSLKVFMSALHMWKAILDEPLLNANVTVGFVMDAPGDDKAGISEGFTTIFIADKKAPAGASISQAYSLTAFANLDIEKAVADGGSFVNLRDSVKRGAKEPASTTTAITTEFWLNHVSLIREQFESTAFYNEILAKMNEKDGKPPRRTELAENLIDDMCEIHILTQKIYNSFGGKTWNDIKAKKDKEAKEAEAAAIASEGHDGEVAA